MIAVVLAADLSLGGTGYAFARIHADRAPQVGVWTVEAPPRDRRGDPVPMPARHGMILGPLFGAVDACRTVPVIVVKEERLTAAGGRQPGSSKTGQDLAGLHAVAEYGLWRRAQPFVDVPGPVLKKYATGRGGCAKEDVRVAAAKRLEHLAECTDNNQSDALWLLVMACAAYGLQLVQLPVVQQCAADKLDWPAVAGLDLKGVTAGAVR